MSSNMRYLLSLNLPKGTEEIHSRNIRRLSRDLICYLPNFSKIYSFLSQHFFSRALRPPWALASAFQFHDHFTDGRTPGLVISLSQGLYLNTGQTRTQNKRIHTPNIYALSGIRAHDPSVRASENSSCLRPLGYCDRLSQLTRCKIFNVSDYMVRKQNLVDENSNILQFCPIPARSKN
jgi:hypothetical protein